MTAARRTRKKRTIVAVTGTRAEFGIMRSLLLRLRDHQAFRLRIVATAGQLRQELGSTWQEIEAHGFTIDAKVPMRVRADDRQAVAETAGYGAMNLAKVVTELGADLVLLTGDRYEALAAAMAAYLQAVPIIHLHGGELTFGAMDDSIRHAITKLAHVHFTSTAVYARRIRQMGEEPWRVHNVGAPSLDGLRDEKPPGNDELAEIIGFDPAEPTVLLTYHPATAADEPPGRTFRTIARALDAFDGHILVTGPNADPGSREILREIGTWSRRNRRVAHVPSLGHRAYLALLARAVAMVGNSSSGIIEAASFRLPVLNIGDRQAGRLRPRNVVDTAASAAAIARGLRRVLSRRFRRSLRGLRNPYGAGRSAGKMLSVLERLPDRSTLLHKEFRDLPVGGRTTV